MDILQTVNVVLYKNDSIDRIKSYPQSDEGNQEAEKIFGELVMKNDESVTPEELEIFIEDGYYEQGFIQIFLIHSM